MIINRVHSKLREIADEICDYVDRMNIAEVGLYSSMMGSTFFLAYYSRYTDDVKYKLAYEKILDICIISISNGVYYHTYCSGVAGMLYGISHLKKNNFLDIDMSEAQEYYNDFLRLAMIKDMNNGNNDFLHGATGVALYLLENHSRKDIDAVIRFVEHLELTGITKKDTIKWASEVDRNTGKAYSISLSHGMSSIAIFLSKVMSRGIEESRVNLLLSKTVNYILEQEVDKDKYGCYFSYTSIESAMGSIVKSRLAWCYGDLGVAMALWRIGVSINNDVCKNKAIEVLDFSTSRIDLDSNMVKDAGICHGTAGIAQLFRRIYLDTGDDKFLRASNYWISETLKMAKWKDGLAGYKSWQGINPEWVNDYSFLEGISGIGLALLASIGDKSYSDWDEILLLS